MGRIDLCQEPWVNRDAVSSHANSGLQDVDTWMSVRDFDRLVRVHSESVRDHCEFIRQGDVHVPVGVFHDFDELGRDVVREEDFPFDERAVDGPRAFSSRLGERADDAIVFHDLIKDVSRKNSLRAVDQAYVGVYFEPGISLNYWRD